MIDVCIKPVSKTEIAITHDYEYNLADIIPATPEAVLEWIWDIADGAEIAGGYTMETDPVVLGATEHYELGRMVAKVVEDYNRPHTVAFWIEHHGAEEAARLEKVYWA